jgi:hypothetical protein
MFRVDRRAHACLVAGPNIGADDLDAMLALVPDAHVRPRADGGRILSRGRVAFERDPVDLHRLRVRTYSRHADYQPVERLFREATKRRAQAAVRLG